MNEIEKRVKIIDCETTGMNADEDRIVELASMDWTDPGFGNEMTTLVNPGVPLPATASAVHHITDDMVADAIDIISALKMFEGAPIYCAHNARFDQQFIPFQAHWICTYKVAIKLWPEAPAHTNQALRYWLNLGAIPMSAEMLPHRALFDVKTTAIIFERAMNDLTVAQMVAISRDPALLPRFSFGQHVGVPLEDVPASYLDWILNRNDFEDEDVLHTPRTFLLMN